MWSWYLIAENAFVQQHNSERDRQNKISQKITSFALTIYLSVRKQIDNDLELINNRHFWLGNR